jgi:integrase
MGVNRRDLLFAYAAPPILTVDQFETIIALLKEPYRTMAYIAQCLGLRVSEIAALRWDDFDFEKN